MFIRNSKLPAYEFWPIAGHFHHLGNCLSPSKWQSCTFCTVFIFYVCVFLKYCRIQITTQDLMQIIFHTSIKRILISVSVSYFILLLCTAVKKGCNPTIPHEMLKLYILYCYYVFYSCFSQITTHVLMQTIFHSNIKLEHWN